MLFRKEKPRIQSFRNAIQDLKNFLKESQICQTPLLNGIALLKEIILQNKSINLNACSMEDKVKDFKNRAVSVYHPCGTCRMGKNPNNSSVSEEFKLRGLRNLWVVDASLFPNITSGNINAPTMMLAFKASEAIIKQIKNT